MYDPISELPTHEVLNQPPIFGDVNLFDRDAALRDAVVRHGASHFIDKFQGLGEIMGRADTYEIADLANKNKPTLKTFDRYGRRVDEVVFHPGYHQLMALGVGYGIPSIAWTADKGGHVAHTALEFLFAQVEGGACCPLTMTYAAVPVIRRSPELAAVWEEKLLSRIYDPKMAPIADKSGATMGMAMTEKQGGSDVRANTTRATHLEGPWYSLVGHKWFCSAPMSDAFLTLAQTDEGLTCFLVPRWRPDGRRNPFYIQRLKDKLGNWSNASSEIEYNDTWAHIIGDEGRGVPTIIEMVHHTRLDTAMAPTALMRQALTQALHHCSHRTAFQKKLIDQPLMRQVLADLAIEVEASIALLFRVAEAYDSKDAAFARLAVAIAKYHINKRAPNFVYEAMECLGGIGYVEESILARLYREAPLNSIWEGSGNVICLDVLRTGVKEPAALEAYFAELARARGAYSLLDHLMDDLRDKWNHPAALEAQARHVVEAMAVALQAALLAQFAPAAVADAFVNSRIGGERGRSYGSFDRHVDNAAILARTLIVA